MFVPLVRVVDVANVVGESQSAFAHVAKRGRVRVRSNRIASLPTRPKHFTEYGGDGARMRSTRGILGQR